MKYIVFFLSFLLVCTLASCKKEAEYTPKQYPFVNTLQPHVTPSMVTLSADIISLGSDSAISAGFVWSTNPDPVLIDNKKFISGEVTKGTYQLDFTGGLHEGRGYYVRSVILTKKLTVYGNQFLFKCIGSNPPEITNFTPKHGTLGTKVMIEGKNFAPSYTGNKVTFGNVNAIIDSVSEDKLVVRVIGFNKATSVNISITTAEMKTTSSDSFKIIYPWSQKLPFDKVKHNSTSFSVGDYGYVINCWDDNLLTYNPETDSWDYNSALPENAGNNPLSIATAGKGYALLSTGFWEFTPQTNHWERKADFPDTITEYTYGFTINDDVYIGNCHVSNGLWKFIPNQNRWERKADFTEPPGLNDITWGFYSFSSHNKGYLGIASERNIKKLWQYDPVTDSWSGKTALPSYAYNAFCTFVIDNEAYVGLGKTPSWVDYASKSIWKYDDANDKWIQYHDCTVNLLSLVSFNINKKGYTVNTNSVWRFNPSNN